MPGDSGKVSFSIAASNSSTNAIPYAINWTNVENTFTNDSKDLVYTLTHTDSEDGTYVSVDGEQPCPSGPEQIGDNGSLPAGKTHSYELTVTFKETYSDQNSDQGKHFYGKIEVTTGGASELYYNSANSTGTSSKPTAPEP